MDYSNHGSQNDAQENERNNNNCSCPVNSSWGGIEFRREVLVVDSRSNCLEKRSIPSVPGSERTNLSGLAIRASARLFPNSSSRTRGALNSISSNCSLWTMNTLRFEVVLRVFVKVLILITIIAVTIRIQCRSFRTRNTASCQESLQSLAFDFREAHHNLSALSIPEFTSNDYWILHAVNEMHGKALSPTEDVMLMISFVFLLGIVNVSIFQMNSHMPEVAKGASSFRVCSSIEKEKACSHRKESMAQSSWRR